MNRKRISDKDWLKRESERKKNSDIIQASLSALFGIILIFLAIYYHKVVAPVKLSRSIYGYQYWIYIIAIVTSGLALSMNGLMKFLDIKRKYY
jgi:hypothetical protein